MARCGCSGTSCSCQIVGSGAISVTGSGSGASPYVIGGGGTIGVTDSATVDLTLTGTGSGGSPYNLTADATVAMEDLINLDTTGIAAGYVPSFNGTSWHTIPAPSAAPGAVNTDATIDGDGSAGSPLHVAEMPTQSYTPIWTADGTSNPSVGSGSITGRYLDDPASNWVNLSIQILAASDTTKGSGVWSISLPPGLDAISGRLQILPLLFTYPNGYIRIGQALMNGGPLIYRLYISYPTSSYGAIWANSSNMSDWPSGGRLAICGRYEREP